MNKDPFITEANRTGKTTWIYEDAETGDYALHPDTKHLIITIYNLPKGFTVDKFHNFLYKECEK